MNFRTFSTYCTFFFLFPASLLAKHGPHAEFRAIVSGDAERVIEWLSRALESPALKADPLPHARTLEMLGEQYCRLSVIGEAELLWEKALQLRITGSGDSSAEAGRDVAHPGST